MKIPTDKIQHAFMGALAVVAMCIAYVIHIQFNFGWAVAFMTTAFGVFYEYQQWYRKEGQPDVFDALATALPGWVFLAAYSLAAQ